MRRAGWIIAAGLALSVVAWAAVSGVVNNPAPAPSTHVLAVGSVAIAVVGAGGAKHTFEVELATTPDQLTQGLMYRRELAPDAGMLFDFGTPQAVSMWMKNTYIPLDMLFIADDGRIVSIAQRAVPESLAIIASPGPVRAVLEVNGGSASQLGIQPGDRVVGAFFASP